MTSGTTDLRRTSPMAGRRWQFRLIIFFFYFWIDFFFSLPLATEFYWLTPPKLETWRLSLCPFLSADPSKIHQSMNNSFLFESYRKRKRGSNWNGWGDGMGNESSEPTHFDGGDPAARWKFNSCRSAHFRLACIAHWSTHLQPHHLTESAFSPAPFGLLKDQTIFCWRHRLCAPLSD